MGSILGRLAKLQGGRSMLTERDKRKLRKIRKFYQEEYAVFKKTEDAEGKRKTGKKSKK